MKPFLGLVGVVALASAACTGSNAASCMDGTCSDPGKAYCDVDGSMSGTPGLCIHVECTAGEFVSCQGGKALVCNAQGNSYEPNTCLNGQCDEGAGGCVACNSNADCSGSLPACDTGKHECVGCLMSDDCPASRPACDVPKQECVGCVGNADCSGSTPVCDTAVQSCVGCLLSSQCSGTKPFCDLGSHACRRCDANNECASDLCDTSTGACVDASAIIYAAPQGGGGACGTQAVPCSISVAFTLLDATHKIIKMSPGAYTANDLTVNAKAVDLYGAGSTLTSATTSAFKVVGNARLTVNGLSVIHSGSSLAINVTGSGPTMTFVALNGVRLDTNGVLSISNYSMTIDRSTLNFPAQIPGDAPWISIQSSGVLTVRRSFLNHGGFMVNNGQFHVANSVIKDGPNSAITIVNTIGGMNDVAFTTFINAPIDQTLQFPVVTMTNNIHFGLNAVQTNVVTGNAFTHSYALMNPQAADPPNSSHVLRNMDPKFVNPAGSDYHLMVGSPAIDAADPAAMLSEDYDGNVRPVGGGRDLGAFEKQ